ncbi:YihY/virulence factor BrkB family protein [Brevibacterium ihuae]|uniref:YihY/virulence factor BrkB family protein n=1 Tax=Brevibacterium ihuae TaxID=1631743 RepID=UPI000C78E0BD|nr:YihY/virulence factor BrkB family protein [Brevibacterium ihuae]
MGSHEKHTDSPLTGIDPEVRDAGAGERDTSGAGLPEHAAQPSHADKPDSPTDLKPPSWKYIARTTLREYLDDECMDLAAGLTYRMVLSMFPAIIALVSMLSLVGQSGSVIESVLREAERFIPADTWNTVEPALSAVLTAPAPGLGLIIGLVVALWTASGYVKAFGRAMNGIYDVPEGRGLVKINAQMYGLTALLLALGAVALVIFVVSGPVAEFVGGLIGLSGTAVAVWDIAKWFLLAVVVIVIVALLYYATPNVRQPKFRWISIGAVVAIVIAVLATLGFFFYVTNFGNYNATYGALAGVIILLLWLYIVNAVLLLGAEIDAELERGRELQAGLPAEREIQLPPRDTTASDAKEKKFSEDVERARALRVSAGETADPDEAKRD